MCYATEYFSILAACGAENKIACANKMSLEDLTRYLTVCDFFWPLKGSLVRFMTTIYIGSNYDCFQAIQELNKDMDRFHSEEHK